MVIQYIHVCMHILGHHTLFSLLGCECAQAVTVTNTQLDLDPHAYNCKELITSTKHVEETLQQIVPNFLKELCKVVRLDQFLEYMQQPTTKLCSGELPTRVTQKPKEGIAIYCADTFHWYMLRQLQRIPVAKHRILVSALNDIEKTVFSYLDGAGRIFRLPCKDKSFVFVLDPYYEHFSSSNLKDDLHFVEECVINFLKKKHGIKSPNIRYWTAQHAAEEFTGTHEPVPNNCYDAESSELVTGYEKCVDTVNDDSSPLGGDVFRDIN